MTDFLQFADAEQVTTRKMVRGYIALSTNTWGLPAAIGNRVFSHHTSFETLSQALVLGSREALQKAAS
jgi:hypothetical protein